MGSLRHYRTCNLCESMCGVVIEHDNATVQAIRGDEEDPFSRGHLCPKALALKDLQEDPDRLRRPLRRRGESWEEIGWDEALDEVAQRLIALRHEHGADSVAAFSGNPLGHNHGAALYWLPFVAALGTRNRYSVASVDQLPHMVVSKAMFGHAPLLPVPDLDRTDLLVIMGGNPLVSKGSVMTAGDVRRRLRVIQQRGGRVVVIDPRRTETAKRADAHHFIHPGTDALLLLAVLKVIIDEGLERSGHLAEHVDGLDEVRRVAGRADLDRVAEQTAVSRAAIVTLAREFARAERAVWYGRVGTSTQAFGALAQWLINLINLITDNLDVPGGAMFTTPAIDLVTWLGLGERSASRRRRARRGASDVPRRRLSRVRKLPAFAGEFPVAALADEILTPGQGQTRGLVTIATNPVLSCPSGRRLDEAFAALEFMVSIDFYLNETTRHADIILPPTAPLERDHYDVVFNLVAVRNTAKYSPALFNTGPEQRHDWQILSELTRRLAADRLPFGGRVLGALMGWIRPEHLLNLALRLGPYGLRERRLDLTKLREHPHGLDLGELRQQLPGRLGHGGRLQAAPRLLIDDLARLRRRYRHEAEQAAGPVEVPAAPEVQAELLLFGRRELRSKNSWLHNSARLVRGKPRCVALLHPDDASARGIRDGETVSVSSVVGSIELPAELSRDVCQGTICIPHGWGHDRPGIGMRVAQRQPGVSVNDVIDDRLVDELCGTSVLNGVPVQVRAAP